MPYDQQNFSIERTSLRAAVLDLMARTPSRDDAAYRAALCELVSRTRGRADDLWVKYRGEEADTRARAYAKYSY